MSKINNAEAVNKSLHTLYDEYVNYMIRNNDGMENKLDIDKMLKLNIVEPFDKLEALKPRGLYFVVNNLKPLYVAQFDEEGFADYMGENHLWRRLEYNLNNFTKIEDFIWDSDDIRPIPSLGWNAGSKFYKFLGDAPHFKYLNWQSDKPWGVKE